MGAHLSAPWCRVLLPAGRRLNPVLSRHAASQRPCERCHPLWGLALTGAVAARAGVLLPTGRRLNPVHPHLTPLPSGLAAMPPLRARACPKRSFVALLLPPRALHLSECMQIRLVHVGSRRSAPCCCYCPPLTLGRVPGFTVRWSASHGKKSVYVCVCVCVRFCVHGGIRRTSLGEI